MYLTTAFCGGFFGCGMDMFTLNHCSNHAWDHQIRWYVQVKHHHVYVERKPHFWTHNCVSPVSCWCEGQPDIITTFQGCHMQVIHMDTTMLSTCRCSLMKKVWGKAADSAPCPDSQPCALTMGHTSSLPQIWLFLVFLQGSQSKLIEVKIKNPTAICGLWVISRPK